VDERWEERGLGGAVGEGRSVDGGGEGRRGRRWEAKEEGVGARRDRVRFGVGLIREGERRGKGR